MPSRHHVLVNKSFENCQAGQRVALSPKGIEGFSKGKWTGHLTALAEEFEDGRIQLVGAKAPLELAHSRTLLQRNGTLVDDYLDRAKNPPPAKEPAADRKAAGPAQAR